MNLIRGVNRQIIEVCETENAFFEKVILFVRPDYMEESETELKNQADRMLRRYGHYPKKRKKQARVFAMLKLLSVALCGAAVAIIIMKLSMG